MSYLLALMFIVIGVCFGRKVLHQTGKNYDLNLLIVITAFFLLGGNTQVFRIYDFKGMLSMIISPFILGILIRRSIHKYIQKSQSQY